jgi:hypothetical protein
LAAHPNGAGLDDPTVLAAAVAVFERESVAGSGQADPRLTAFLADFEAAGAADEDHGWVSVWPLGVSADGLAVPTTYADVDDNFVVLLRLAARHGLVLVDLDAQTVHRPAQASRLVSRQVTARLGALTYRRLESIVSGLPRSDPWIVLERDRTCTCKRCVSRTGHSCSSTATAALTSTSARGCRRHTRS